MCGHCWLHCGHVCGVDAEDEAGNLVMCWARIECEDCVRCHDHCGCSTVTPDDPPAEPLARFGGAAYYDLSYVTNRASAGTAAHSAGLASSARQHATQGIRSKLVSSWLTTPYLQHKDLRAYTTVHRCYARLAWLRDRIANRGVELLKPDGTLPRKGQMVLDQPLPVDAEFACPPGFRVVPGYTVARAWAMSQRHKRAIERHALAFRHLLIPALGFPRLSVPGTKSCQSSEAHGDFVPKGGARAAATGRLVAIRLPGCDGVRVYVSEVDLDLHRDWWVTVSEHALMVESTLGYIIVGVENGTRLHTAPRGARRGSHVTAGPLSLLSTAARVHWLPRRLAVRNVDRIAKAARLFGDVPVSIGQLSRATRLTEDEVILSLSHDAIPALTHEDSGCYTRLVGGRTTGTTGLRLKPRRLSSLTCIVTEGAGSQLEVRLTGAPCVVHEGHLRRSLTGEVPTTFTPALMVNGRVGMRALRQPEHIVSAKERSLNRLNGVILVMNG